MANYQLLLIDEEDSVELPVIVNEICRYDRMTRLENAMLNLVSRKFVKIS